MLAKRHTASFYLRMPARCAIRCCRPAQTTRASSGNAEVSIAKTPVPVESVASASKQDNQVSPATAPAGGAVQAASTPAADVTRQDSEEAAARQQEQSFHEAYAKAYTMSQLYVKNRPPPVPLSEYEERRKKRDMAEIGEVRTCSNNCHD